MNSISRLYSNFSFKI